MMRHAYILPFHRLDGAYLRKLKSDFIESRGRLHTFILKDAGSNR